jgi:AcrR family transcriptional regulator
MSRSENVRQLGKRTQEESEKTKERVLTVALEVFARAGFASANLRKIAELAGTTHSLIRHHFGSKEDLWRAVVDYGLQLHIDSLKEVNKSLDSSDPVEIYKRFITAYVAIVAKHPELSQILNYESNRSREHIDYLIERQNIIHEIVQPIFKQVQSCGYFQEYDHDSFFVYLSALVVTPFARYAFSKKLLKNDVLSPEGIALHTKRVLNFLFPGT